MYSDEEVDDINNQQLLNKSRRALVPGDKDSKNNFITISLDVSGMKVASCFKSQLGDLGLIRRYSGTCYVWCRCSLCWLPLATSEVARELVDIGYLTAPVNYSTAILPYTRLIRMMALPVTYIPVSICVGSVRLTPSIHNNSINFSLSKKSFIDINRVSECAGYFSVSPLEYSNFPSSIDLSKETIWEKYFSQCFDSVHDEKLFLWLVGNSILDPVVQGKVCIIYGRGGTGKTTILNFLSSSLPGLISALDPLSLLSSSSAARTSESLLNVSSVRIAVAGECDMSSQSVNLPLIKSLTGGDIQVSKILKACDTKLKLSIFAGTNSLPNIDKNKEWLSTQIMRRMLIIEFPNIATVRFRTLSEANDDDRLHLIGLALRERISNKLPYITVKTILMTILGSKYLEVSQYLIYLDSELDVIDFIHSNLVLNFISNVLEISYDILIELIRSISHNSIKYYLDIPYVPGVSLLSF